MQGSLIAPLLDENGQPVNSKIDKRHGMFASDIKRYISDYNLRQGGGSGHLRQSSQPLTQ